MISDWANRVDKNAGYYTIDAKLSYAWKGLKAFVGVNNLTNQKYAELGRHEWHGDEPDSITLRPSGISSGESHTLFKTILSDENFSSDHCEKL